MEFNTKLVGVVRAIYIYIAEMPGVNLCQNTSYPHCDFPQSLQANVRPVPWL